MVAAVWGLAGLLAAAYGAIWSDAGPFWAKTAVKTASVALLAVAGARAGAPGAIVAGLALGALGDLFLSRPGQGAFLAGMAAFALGHLAYAAQFWTTGGAPSALWAIVLGLLVLSTEGWLAPRTGALRWPVRAYALIIGLMAFAATGHGLTWAVVGAFLFLLSDLLLSFDLFLLPQGRARPVLRRTLWAAYWGGQALILFGMLPAAAG